jgi:hypothetical protein
MDMRKDNNTTCSVLSNVITLFYADEWVDVHNKISKEIWDIVGSIDGGASGLVKRLVNRIVGKFPD